LATAGSAGRIVTVSDSNSDPFRICALCRHFQVLESKREFPQIADSAYMKYACAKLGWESREDYLMSSDPKGEYQAAPNENFDCPYWEAPP
jgi:hypothetical protein